MLIAAHNKEKGITESRIREAVGKFFAENDYSRKRLLLILPDNTRSGPMDILFQAIYDCIGTKAGALDVLIALGTHQPMAEEDICKRLGITTEQRNGKYASVKFFNHEWEKAETFTSIGRISADEIGEISDGLFSEEVNVSINKLIFGYDEFFIVGPVFPHEVVGFSGGHKYLFPGIAAAEIINFFHWLGAVITNPKINGQKLTPTRQIVEKAASFITMPHKFFAAVATEAEVFGVFIGDTMQAWEQAADLSSQVHIVYKDRAYHTVLGLAPVMYDDMWTAGKVMYKLEPVIADGGTLIIHAPHIDEISYTHGEVIDRIGYHTRDYFLKQWDKFKQYPHGVIAHSTHVRGIGTFADTDGIEKPRVNVVLATKIPKERCEKVNLGYMDPASIDISEYENKENEGILLVHHAGEKLYRLASGQVPQIKDLKT